MFCSVQLYPFLLLITSHRTLNAEKSFHTARTAVVVVVVVVFHSLAKNEKTKRNGVGPLSRAYVFQHIACAWRVYYIRKGSINAPDNKTQTKGNVSLHSCFYSALSCFIDSSHVRHSNSIRCRWFARRYGILLFLLSLLSFRSFKFCLLYTHSLCVCVCAGSFGSTPVCLFPFLPTLFCIKRASKVSTKIMRHHENNNM